MFLFTALTIKADVDYADTLYVYPNIELNCDSIDWSKPFDKLYYTNDDEKTICLIIPVMKEIKSDDMRRVDDVASKQ